MDDYLHSQSKNEEASPIDRRLDDGNGFPRFLVVSSANTDTSLNKLNCFVVGKAFKCQVGSLKTVRPLQRGDILAETTSKSQSDRVLSLKDLAGVPVVVTPHRSLNTSKGVIRCREIALCDKEEIVQELKSQGVTDATVITVKDGSSRKKTNTVILTFNTPTPPKYISAEYIRTKVELYIPNPLRCFNCQKFGHGKSNCKGRTTCIQCGEVGHNNTDCDKQERCANCKGCHSAASK